jgi:hypothetical protein
MLSGGALAAPNSVALAATCNWIGTTGNWSETTNWSCAAVPGSGDTAIIDNGGTVTLDMDVTVQSLTLSGFSTLGGSDAITVTNMMAWSSHTYMVGTGDTNIASGAILNLTVGWGNYGNHFPVLDTRTLNIVGTAFMTNTVSADIYSRLGLANGAIINNSGILDFQNDTGIAQDNGSTGSVNNSGTFRKSGGTGTSPVSGVLVNNTGTVQALIGTLSFNGFTQNSGVTMLNGGSLESVSSPLNFYGGTLEGVGSINGDVANIGGTVSPGSSPGNLHIAGNYTQGLAGTLNIELGGYVSGTQYDLLDVTGLVTLSGALNVSLINNFMPITGDVFRIINFSTRSGDFVTEIGLIVGDCILLPTYSSDNLSLIAVVNHKVYIPLAIR